LPVNEAGRVKVRLGVRGGASRRDRWRARLCRAHTAAAAQPAGFALLFGPRGTLALDRGAVRRLAHMSARARRPACGVGKGALFVDRWCDRALRLRRRAALRPGLGGNDRWRWAVVGAVRRPCWSGLGKRGGRRALL